MSNHSFSSPVNSTRVRPAVMAAGGLAVAVVVGLLGSRAYAPAIGWAAASLIYLVWVWSVVGRLNASATSAHALREDPGRLASDILVLAATMGSFGGVALILLDAGSVEGERNWSSFGVALGRVAHSWPLVYTRVETGRVGRVGVLRAPVPAGGE